MPSNYSTRPNKHVDRELFVDLVGRSLSSTQVDRCAYLSMGGPQMADHIAMYRRNGVAKLYSFDFEEHVISRQKFNAPTIQTICERCTAAEIPAKLEDIKTRLDADRVVVWFDYTGTGERGAQLAEFQSLLEALAPGDIARVALDASLPAERLEANLPVKDRGKGIYTSQALLKREFGGFHPETFELEARNDMPKYLAQCISHLCDRSAQMKADSGNTFIPMLQTCYTDSVPMFTAAVLVQDGSGQPAAPIGFNFLANSWDDIESLEIPELTAREKSFLDRLLNLKSEELIKELGYEIARGPQTIRQWKSFQKFHRFLPQFQHVELK